jgi:hypothetical protein
VWVGGVVGGQLVSLALGEGQPESDGPDDGHPVSE